MAYIKERNTVNLNMHSVYQKKKTICLNRGRTESLGNDDVLALNNAKSPQVRNGEDDVKQENARKDRLG